jgi:hypothetical protein
MHYLFTRRPKKVCSQILVGRVLRRSSHGQTLAPGGEKLLNMWARLALTRNYSTPMVLTCLAQVLDGRGGWLHAMSQRMEKQRSLRRTQDAELAHYLGLNGQPSSKEIYHRCQEVYERFWAKTFTQAYAPFLRFRSLDSSNLHLLGHLPGLVKRQQSMDFHLEVPLPGEKFLGCYGDRKALLLLQPEENYYQVLFQGSLDLYLQALAQQKKKFFFLKLSREKREILSGACDTLSRDPGNKKLQVKILVECLLETGFYPPLWVQESLDVGQLVYHEEDRLRVEMLLEEFQELVLRHEQGLPPEENIRLLQRKQLSQPQVFLPAPRRLTQGLPESITRGALDNEEMRKIHRPLAQKSSPSSSGVDTELD